MSTKYLTTQELGINNTKKYATEIQAAEVGWELTHTATSKYVIDNDAYIAGNLTLTDNCSSNTVNLLGFRVNELDDQGMNVNSNGYSYEFSKTNSDAISDFSHIESITFHPTSFKKATNKPRRNYRFIAFGSIIGQQDNVIEFTSKHVDTDLISIAELAKKIISVKVTIDDNGIYCIFDEN